MKRSLLLAGTGLAAEVCAIVAGAWLRLGAAGQSEGYVLIETEVGGACRCYFWRWPKGTGPGLDRSLARAMRGFRRPRHRRLSWPRRARPRAVLRQRLRGFPVLSVAARPGWRPEQLEQTSSLTQHEKCE